LTVSQPGDPYETEADQVAETVMRMEGAPSTGSQSLAGPASGIEREPIDAESRPQLLRQALDDDTDGESPAELVIEEAADDVVPDGSPVVAENAGTQKVDSTDTAMTKQAASTDGRASPRAQNIRIPLGAGIPLEGSAREFMEQRFGYDFGAVRIHTDRAAAESARSLRAQAYTLGSHIYFNQGEYAPGDSAGRRLLAHELTHVVQQARGPASPVMGRDSRPISPAASHGLVARQATGATVRTGRTVVTRFHPGVAHNHQPTGRWAAVQADASTRCGSATSALAREVGKGFDADPKKLASLSVVAGVECTCANSDVSSVSFYARNVVLGLLPLAQAHLDHYLSGGGSAFLEDAAAIIQTDQGVRTKLAAAIKKANIGHFKINQSDYSVKDFQYAFGAIDRLDFEVDRKAGLVYVWFQDRYEWHPVGFGYSFLAGDGRRESNCVHAALVEMKTSGAADFWMLGDAIIPIGVITGASSP